MEAHPHDHGHDHDHEHEHPHVHAEEHSHGRAHTHGHGDEPDRVALTHIGLDVGAATTKLLACRLTLASHGHGQEDLRVAQRQVLFRSPVSATPYSGSGSVDVGQLEMLFLELCKDAPIPLDAADTRLAVLTGPAAEHRGEVLKALGKAGFECLVAGPHLNGALTAYGADAVARSVDLHGEPRTIVNVDIGATLARLALCRGGEILQTATIRVGPRLVRLDATGRVEGFDEALGPVAEAAEVTLDVGTEVSAAQQKALADELAECLLNLIERRPLQPLTRRLLTSEPLDWPDRLNGASFSGGAAAYVYGSQEQLGGDLGPALGRAIHQRLNRLGFAVQEPEHLLTAAIIGSAHYRLEDIHGMPILTEPHAFAAAQERDAQLAAT